MGYRERDGFTLPQGASDPTTSNGLRTNSDLRHVDGNASLSWSSTTGKRVGFDVSAFDAERGVPPEEHISGPRLWRYPYHSRAVLAVSGSSGAFNTPLGLGTVDVGVGYNTGRLKIESFSDRTYSTVSAEELGDERNLAGRVRATHSLGAGTLRAAVTSSDVRYEETLAGATADYRQRLASVGAEVELPLRSATTIAGGVVYDRASTPEAGGRPIQAPLDNVGWRAGLTHEMNSSFRLHASGSQRSRFPALRELYSGSLNRFLPNPNLRPESLLGVEAGATIDRSWASATSVFEVTGFVHDLRDAVVRVTLPAPDTRFQRVNRDHLRSTGVELLAGARFGASRERSVSLSAEAMLQKISIRDQTLVGQPARHAENNPESRGSIDLGVPLPFRIRGSMDARYTGAQYCLNADTDSEDRLPSKGEFDFGLERSFGIVRGLFRSLRVALTINNVGNTAVFDQCGLTQPGRTGRVMVMLR